MTVVRRRGAPASSPPWEAPDPRGFRISPNFVMSDFLGTHSVYAKGYANDHTLLAANEGGRLDNLTALCYEVLEPILAQYGPLSISYGYISPELSRRVVTYQDPDKPSHHRMDLGAACDICVHDWVQGFTAVEHVIDAPHVAASPILLAHGIHALGLPYSRMITYSESPYICLACADAEVKAGTARKAFYENRYAGRKGAKPAYTSYPSDRTKQLAYEDLVQQGLEHGWQGAGYPTYHNGGHQKYHHMRVSRYTMVSDFLYDLKSVSTGIKNIPALNLDAVQDAFAAAGLVYDYLLEAWGLNRVSIVQGYLSHHHPDCSAGDGTDWRCPVISFTVLPSEGPEGHVFNWIESVDLQRPGVSYAQWGEFVIVSVNVETVLTDPAWASGLEGLT